MTFTTLKFVESAFAAELIAYWLSFVRTGNPNAFKARRSPNWPLYLRGERYRNVLQQNPAGEPPYSGSYLELDENPETERCLVAGSQSSQEN